MGIILDFTNNDEENVFESIKMFNGCNENKKHCIGELAELNCRTRPQ